MGHSAELDQLAPALVAFQSELVPVEKTADNPFFRSKYAPHPEVRKALQPLLAKNGLALTCVPTLIDGENGLYFYLIHKSGQYLSGQWKLTPKDRTPQGEGSDTTYKRRYGDMAITGLVADEDDDGNAASFHNQARQAARVEEPVRKMTPLEVAKNQLRDAITKAGLTREQAAEYGWVKDATDKDIDNIRGLAQALALGKPVEA